MTRVMRGEYDSIRLEPPGPEGKGVEFWLRRGELREYHQAKRQGARRGSWTLNELNNRGVLQAFWSHLADVNVTCVFISIQDAAELRGLSERARNAANAQELEREFAKGEWGSRLAQLREYWTGCSFDEFLSRLSRVRVDPIGEDHLRRLADLELAPLVDANAGAASDVLFAYAFESVHHVLDAYKISDRLKDRGIGRPLWAEPETLHTAVDAVNERYLAFLDRELIRGELIQRDECTPVLAALQEGSAKRGVIVTGRAGSGKSAVLLQVIRNLQKRDVPVLAFRVDRLQPTQRPDEAGKQIGLSESPVTTLAALANGRPCVLVLDQLDAVSLMSGRNSSFFDCFDEMVCQALTVPAMHLLIACRHFDWENDHRLRRLGGRADTFETVEVGHLSNNTVRQVAKAIDINDVQLSEHQLRLLSVPAHLKLLTDAAGQNTKSTLTFQTSNDLYDLFWQQKQLVMQQRLGRPVAWAAVIDLLCDYMNQHQVLSAPEALLDAHAPDVKAMLSEHVLVQDGASISFFHEGFFDYAFARRFAADGRDLVGLLRSGEQHLFRRAQVRQILLYEREIDRPRYHKNLETLLVSADIRFHIKQVVFALLKQFVDPAEAEWRVLEALLQNASYPHSGEIWFAIRTPAWFRLLDSLGVVATWLRQGKSDTVDRAVRLLYGVQRDAADRVAELVEPYIGTSEKWRERHRRLIQWADLGVSRRFFDLFLRLINNGDLDDMGRFRENDFLGLFYNLPERHADWACDAIGHHLQRRLKIALDAGETNPFTDEGGLGHSQLSDRILIGSAQRAPRTFIEQVLPFILRVIDLNALREGEQPWQDSIWRWRRRDGGHGVNDHLLRATEEALRKLAREDPEEFSSVAAPLRKSEYETVQFLLIRAYAANGEKFADEAIDYLCEPERRLSYGSKHATCELIEAATPFCSSERLVRLETMLLGYFTEWEQTIDGLQSRGCTQFDLLLAIDEKRRSTSVRGRIEEWRRKFRVASLPEPPRSGAYTVGSPISGSAVEKMTDDQWLGAIARYSKGHERELRDGRRVGGAHELSQTLEAQVRKEPMRFARLVLLFPDETSDEYFHVVLRGLDAGLAEEEAIFAACQRCHRLPERPAGSTYCHLVEHLPDSPWPDDLLDAIAWYATQDPDPRRERWRKEASSENGHDGSDIYTAGINCVRGAAAGAVGALLSARAERIPRFLPTLRRMVRDPSIAVRSCVVNAVFPLLVNDRDVALELFLELCDTEDVLLQTHYVEMFMRYTTATHFPQLRAILERMLRSDEPGVAQAGARQACIASLDVEEAADLAEQCVAGSEQLRVGAAEVFARNLGSARFQSVCETRLAQLFKDPSEAVRAAAAECFHELENDALGQVPALVQKFEQSPAFVAHHEGLIRALEHTTARLPDATFAVCRRFIEIVGDAAGDIRTRASFDASRVSKLLIRTYHQETDEDLRSRCLDLIDQLLAVGTDGLHRELAEFER